jgi:ADP-ribose pyrophosphatase YjhB (NUDIX family)
MESERGIIGVGSSGIIENNDGRILMVLRIDGGENVWAFPETNVVFGWTSAEAFVRGAKEETGLDISEPRFVVVFEVIKQSINLHRIIFFHKAKVKGGDFVPSDDVKDIRWMDVGEVMHMKNLDETVIPVLKLAGYLK